MAQLHNTTKLFYGKWTRKVVVIAERAGWVNVFKQPEYRVGSLAKYYSVPEFAQVKEVAEFAETFSKSTIQLRGENSRVSIFFNDPQIKDQIVAKFTDRVKEIHEPLSEDVLNVLTTPGRKRVVKKALFKRKFQFKVELKPGASVNEREMVIKWQQTNTKNTSAGDALRLWGNKLNWYSSPAYFYIDNEKTLSMFLLILGNAVKYIEEAVVI